MKIFIYSMFMFGAITMTPNFELSAASVATGSQVTLTSANFDSIINGQKPVVIKVSTDWCGPCKTLAPVYDQVASEYGNKYVFTSVNGDNEFKLVQKLNVKGYPTIIYYNKGQEVGRSSGSQSKADLVRTMTTAFGN